MSDGKYLRGKKAIIDYLGKMSIDTFDLWRKKSHLKTVHASKREIMTKTTWIDEWVASIPEENDEESNDQ